MKAAPVLRYLHLSDLHFRLGDAAREHDQIVVNDSLLKAIENFPKDEPLDFIVLTGDIAFGGQREEYDMAAKFCERLLQITGVEKRRLFLVAGNHDLNRKKVSRTLERLYRSFANQSEITDYLADLDQRPVMMAKFAEFHRFAAQVMGRARYDEQTWHLHELLHLDKAGQEFRCNLLCLNSALLAGYDDDDQQHLALSNYQVDKAIEQLDKDAPLSIGLFHHPFACFHAADQTAQNRLRRGCDLLLTGHLHKAANAVESNAAGQATMITAGAAYETRQDRNSFNRVSIDLTTGQGRVELWKYLALHHCWNRDHDTNPHHPEGLFEFDVPGIQKQPLSVAAAAPTVPAQPPAAPIAGPAPRKPQVHFIHDTNLPGYFTGRVKEQDQLLAWLQPGPVAVAALQALGGMGKSVLARQLLETLREQVDGPYRHLVWYSFYDSRSEDEVAALADLLRALGGDLSHLPDGIAAAEILRQRLSQTLDATPALLVLDGLEVIQHSHDPQASDYGQIKVSHRQTARLLRHLCNQKSSRALVTSRLPLNDLKGTAGYEELKLETFSDAEAADLFQRLGVAGSPEERITAVHPFAGHPLALRAAAVYLHERGIPARQVERLIGDPVRFRASPEAQRVQHIVDAHRAHLSEARQHFLKMLAIHPRAVRLDLHSALIHPSVAGWSLDRVDEELVFPLVRSGLVEQLSEHQHDTHTLYAAHPLMKLAFSAWLDPEGHRRAHADWAKAAQASPALAGSPSDARTLEQLQPWLDVVEHYLAAGEYAAAWGVWRDRRVDFRLNGLGYAALLLALGQRFEQALEAGVWQASARQRSFLYQFLGHACGGLDRHSEVLVYLEKQYTAARETGDAAATVGNGAILADSCLHCGQIAAARALLEALQALAAGLDEGWEKAIYQSVQAKAELWSGNYAAALPRFEQAMQHATPYNRAMNRYYHGEAQLRLGQLEAAASSLTQAQMAAAAFPNLQPAILQGFAWLALKRGDVAEARRLTDQGLALNKDMGQPVADEGLLLVREGRHSEALALAEPHISSPAGGEQLNRDAEIEALLVTAQAHHGLGQLEAAQAALTRARELMQTTGCWHMKDWLAETEALLEVGRDLPHQPLPGSTQVAG